MDTPSHSPQEESSSPLTKKQISLLWFLKRRGKDGFHTYDVFESPANYSNEDIETLLEFGLINQAIDGYLYHFSAYPNKHRARDIQRQAARFTRKVLEEEQQFGICQDNMI